LATFPKRGAERNDIRPSLRITNYRGSTIIAFSVDEKNKTVSIIGLYYGGQDFESILHEE
jgi:toxin ParE1/3/4